MDYQLPLDQFLEQVARHPQEIYLHQPDSGHWRTLSWEEVNDQARRIASGLLDQGYEAGDRIAILSKNCAEWFIADIAIAMAGMISVPIYPSAENKTIEHVLSHSAVRAVFVGKLDNINFAEQALNSSVLRIAMPYPTANAQVNWQAWLGTYSP
jgi:long-subunit acyl-CoA synthetase (AMP-forming)